MMAAFAQVPAGDPVSSGIETPTTEAALVRATLDGDAGAYADLVHMHSRRVYNYIHQMTRQVQDAEDLTQQAFIKAYASLHRFDTERPLINWLLTIARRCTLNHFRAARRWEAISEDVASSVPSPSESAERRDQVESLWERARRDLSQREFEVMWLRYAEEFSVEETARITGLTRPHVKILVFRARHRLMKGMAHP
ncbi:MAG TPA: sigma-70 family RNA polymerase sigma factor [Opitutaceae bacterium]